MSIAVQTCIVLCLRLMPYASTAGTVTEVTNNNNNIIILFIILIYDYFTGSYYFV